MRNHSNENEFDLHENEHASETNFQMNGFAPRLVLRKRQKSTRKWPINILPGVPLHIKPALWLFPQVRFSTAGVAGDPTIRTAIFIVISLIFMQYYMTEVGQNALGV